MELVTMESGSFTQGSPPSEADRGSDEDQREVRISQPFSIGKYPVTRGQWTRFATERRYRTEAEDGTSGGYGWDGQKLTQRRDFTWRNPGFPQTNDHPVTLVTWNDAQAFTKWLGGRTGKQCALPTEAQWEYACRAGTTTPWPTGSNAAAADAWAWHKGNAANTTHPVGKKSANAWGVSDMGGQVWEWCQDWYGPYPQGAATDPLQTNDRLSDKPRRVLRGGSFLKDANGARSAARYRNDARSRNADNGFRVVVLERSPAAPAAPPQPGPSPSPVPAERDDSTLTPGNVSVPAPVTRPPAPVQPFPWPSVSSEKKGSGFPRWLGIMLAIFGAVMLWKFIRSRIGRGGVSPVPFPHSPPVPPNVSDRPSVRLAPDGFWIRGNYTLGTPVFWQYQVGGQTSRGQTGFLPGPDGMFVFTGGTPDSAEAWLENQSPGGPSFVTVNTPDESYSTGGAAGMLYGGLRRDQDRDRERAEEERRREAERARQESRPSRGYPSAY